MTRQIEKTAVHPVNQSASGYPGARATQPQEDRYERGAAMLAGMAAGIYRSADEAISSVQRPSHLVEPDPGVVPMYDTLYDDIYRHLYDALRPLHHRLFDLFISTREGGNT